jgi:hypothetical protein
VIFRVSMPGVKSTPQRLFWLFFNPLRICSVYLHTNVSADILSRSLFLTVSPLSLSFCVCTFFSRRPVPLLAHLLAGSSKSPMLFSLSLFLSTCNNTSGAGIVRVSVLSPPRW